MNHGERVSGRYKVIKKIGSGGMANVYLAEDLILEREVAVKMMSLDFQNDPDSLRRFQREALSTTELTHPNIVNVYDVGEGEQPYIVMEYVAGMDLKEYVIENHPIPYKKVINIMDQILDAIAYAHKNNVIHRDIKPHNILIDKNNNIKITDFGIAVALSQNSITQTNSLLGSVQYISPEQAKGNMVTKQSDIYSLGIVLYELLTGSVPFEGESAVSIALKHFQTPIPSLKEFDSRIPQALENVVLKATAKEAKNRYQTVEEMQEDLKTSLLPSRRDEPIFIPKDIYDEDTLVMDAAMIDAVNTAPVNQVKTQVVTSEPAVQETEPEAEEKPKKKRGWLIFAIVAIIGIFITLALYFSQPKEVIVPDDLIGLTLDQVIALLDENNLELGETLERSNDDYEEGLIFRTNPGVGSTVIEGSVIDVYVSLGEEPFIVKDYEGKIYDEVRAELTDLGFTVESVEATHETISSGDIIAQDIEAGEKVIISETTITFTVSTGRPSIELINLYEFSLPSLEEYVARNNLKLTTTGESSDEVAVGSVIRQEPAAGTKMYSGEEVSVVLSTGPEETRRIFFTRELEIPYEERLAEPEGDENTEPEENDEMSEPELLPSRIEIYIDDLEKDMDTATHVFTIEENTRYPVEFVVEEGKSAAYKIVRDGTTIIEDTISP